LESQPASIKLDLLTLAAEFSSLTRVNETVSAVVADLLKPAANYQHKKRKEKKIHW